MSRKNEVMLTRVENPPTVKVTFPIHSHTASWARREADFLFAFSDFTAAETKVDLRQLFEEHVRHQAIYNSDANHRAFYNELQVNWTPECILEANLSLHRYSLRYWQKACEVVKEDRTILELCSSDPIPLDWLATEPNKKLDHPIDFRIHTKELRLHTELNLDKIQELLTALSIKPATDYMHHDALYNFQLKGTAFFQQKNRSP